MQLKPTFTDNSVVLHNISDFDLAQTLECGQAFRWERKCENTYVGIAHEKLCVISQQGTQITLTGVSKADFEQIWSEYFDFERDYAKVKQQLSSDAALQYAIERVGGVRVLKQEPWEALCSFIISQNNNIVRIKGIVARLCELAGAPMGEGLYAFPTAQRLASMSPDDLAPIRAGFRAKYIIDAARRVASGEVNLSKIEQMPLEKAREALMVIKGVGVKVADCALLYGMGRIDCCPVDVWVGRILGHHYPDGLPACAVGYEGIAQQYLFHCARTDPNFLSTADSCVR